MTQALEPWTLPPMDQEVLRKLLYQRALNCTPVVEPRPVDTEIPRALSLQRTWLELPAVKQRRRLTGWNTPIHRHTRVTYRDVRDTPRWNWHGFMLRQIREEG